MFPGSWVSDKFYCLHCEANLIIPTLDRQGMSYCKPIPMDLEIGRLAGSTSALSSICTRIATYYAGNRSVFRAVTTTAVCAIEGYNSAM